MRDAVVTVVVAAAAIAVVLFGGFYAYSYFGPKYRAVDREIFHQSEQYKDGMIRDMENLRVAWIAASGEQKMALKSTITHRMSVFPKQEMTPELRNFYNEVTSFTGE